MASDSEDPAMVSFGLGHTRAHHIKPDLDTDVLEAICGSIDDIRGLLAVSLTCSVMWRIAICQLLRTHTIHLTSWKAIRGFREFILNQKPTRAHHIRSLVIRPELTLTALNNDVDQLMDILDCAVNLNSLDLTFLAANFRADPARISSAFAGMSALRCLSLEDRRQQWASHALSALQSPLRKLCVRARDEFRFVPSPPTGPFFQMFLRFSSSSTLISLCLDQVPVFDNSFLDLPQFRSVRSLTITKPLEREFKLRSLLHLFPSLDGTLSLHLHFRAKVLRLMSPSRFLEVQEENRRAQGVSRWTGLDRLDCNLETAAMLALRCPVRHLTTDSLDVKHIVNIRPKHLVVAFLRFHFYFSHPRLCPQTPATGSSPTHIVVISSFDSTSCPSSRMLLRIPHNLRWDIAFERLIQDLSLFHDVTHVRLVFHCTQEDPREVELDDFIHEIRERASVGLHLVTTPLLLAACPKLRYFFITVCGNDSQSSQRGWIHAYGWRVVGPEERAQSGDGYCHGESAPAMLEELSDHTARRVIEDEDLGLPEEWERKLEACRT